MKHPRKLPSLLISASILLFVASPILAQADRKVTKLADGVYEIEHLSQPFGSGNTTVIIGDRQVLVIDTCFRPAVAQEDIAQIRQWTDKPVAFVLNTHFHNDHNLGNRAYMDAFPQLTVIAQVETKKDMDMFGPSSARRTEEADLIPLQRMLDTGKAPNGEPLGDDDKKMLTDAISQRRPVVEEIKKVTFQSATMTFDHNLTIDLGSREVQLMFLGRGNTTGDAIAYLPKEKILVTGDLVVYPVPYILDGYPIEWIQTLDSLARINADTIVLGHGPILHDKTYIYLVRDLLKSAVDQMNEKLRQTRPAMFQTLDDVKAGVDLTPFRQRFAGDDKDRGAEFDGMTASLIKAVFQEASLR